MAASNAEHLLKKGRFKPAPLALVRNSFVGKVPSLMEPDLRPENGVSADHDHLFSPPVQPSMIGSQQGVDVWSQVKTPTTAHSEPLVKKDWLNIAGHHGVSLIKECSRLKSESGVIAATRAEAPNSMPIPSVPRFNTSLTNDWSQRFALAKDHTTGEVMIASQTNQSSDRKISRSDQAGHDLASHGGEAAIPAALPTSAFDNGIAEQESNDDASTRSLATNNVPNADSHYLEEHPELKNASPPVFRQRHHARSFKATVIQNHGREKTEEAFPGAFEMICKLNPDHFAMSYGTRVINIKTDDIRNVYKGLQLGRWSTHGRVSERIMTVYKAQVPYDERILFLVAINGSKAFCGLAEMTGAWDPQHDLPGWVGTGNGSIPINWLYLKNVTYGHFSNVKQDRNDQPVINMWNGMTIDWETGRKAVETYVAATHFTNILCWNKNVGPNSHATPFYNPAKQARPQPTADYLTSAITSQADRLRVVDRQGDLDHGTRCHLPRPTQDISGGPVVHPVLRAQPISSGVMASVPYSRPDLGSVTQSLPMAPPARRLNHDINIVSHVVQTRFPAIKHDVSTHRGDQAQLNSQFDPFLDQRRGHPAISNTQNSSTHVSGTVVRNPAFVRYNSSLSSQDGGVSSHSETCANTSEAGLSDSSYPSGMRDTDSMAGYTPVNRISKNTATQDCEDAIQLQASLQNWFDKTPTKPKYVHRLVGETAPPPLIQSHGSNKNEEAEFLRMIADRIELDAKIEAYRQRGLDETVLRRQYSDANLSTYSASAYPNQIPPVQTHHINDYRSPSVGGASVRSDRSLYASNLRAAYNVHPVGTVPISNSMNYNGLAYTAQNDSESMYTFVNPHHYAGAQVVPHGTLSRSVSNATSMTSGSRRAAVSDVDQ